MIQIEMDVFSGLPNPRWNLDKATENDMISRVLDGGLRTMPVDHEVGFLGYRGFRIRASGKAAEQLASYGLATSFYVTSAGRPGDGSQQDTERSLIESSVGLFDDVGEHALERLTEIAKERSLTESHIPTKGEAQRFESEQDLSDGNQERGSCYLAVTSNSNFNFWNGSSHVRRNNCYNYGSNWRNNTFAQPGKGSTGRAFWETQAMNAANCKQACYSDGYLSSNPCDGVGHYKMAVVAWPNRDFHFYRRVQSDSGGARWADKAGQTRAKNTDNAGQIIRSPYSANRGNYTDWGGYLYRHRTISPNIR